MKHARILTVVWLLTIVILFLYSFSQIDLGLTLTRVSFWQIIQKKFQYLGYFQRPLSTSIYLGIIFFLFLFYFLILKSVKKGKFTPQSLWRLILLTALILWLAYNAFSYDFFNYIFYGKIITYYHQNPYQRRALDFPEDPMLGFMHWTHNYYPYGPLWLIVTLPLSFLGFQELIPTMILFKGIAVASYLASSWFIYQILERINSKGKLVGLAIFAFHPLIIIESLVSAHNDIFMIMLSLAGFWLWLKKKYLFSWLALLASIGVKFATGFLIPAFLLLSFYQRQRKKINWGKIWLLSFVLMTAALLGVTRRSEIQPWYLLYLLPFVGLMPQKRWLFWPVTTLSIGLLLTYAPFLYLGHWKPPVPSIKNWLTIGSLALGSLLSLTSAIRRQIAQGSNRV